MSRKVLFAIARAFACRLADSFGSFFGAFRCAETAWVDHRAGGAYRDGRLRLRRDRGCAGPANAADPHPALVRVPMAAVDPDCQDREGDRVAQGAAAGRVRVRRQLLRRVRRGPRADARRRGPRRGLADQEPRRDARAVGRICDRQEPPPPPLVLSGHAASLTPY